MLKPYKSICREWLQTFSNDEFEDSLEFLEFLEFSCSGNTNPVFLFEAVISLKQEEKWFNNFFNVNKGNILKCEDLKQLKLFLENEFKNRKIKLFFITMPFNDDLKNKILVKGGGFNDKIDNISLYINSVEVDNLLRTKNKEIYKIFKEQMYKYIIHESIHREHFLRIKHLKIREKLWDEKKSKSHNLEDEKNYKKYLSDNFEIMSYSWQIVNNLRCRNLDDKNIKSFLSNPKKYQAESKIIKLGGQVFEDYIYFFGNTKDSTVLKKLFDNMFRYLD